ncbi:MAG: hypothetical protein WD535_04040 [Thermaerobacterales bacterium]
MIFSVRADAEGFAERRAELEQAGRWQFEEATPPFVSLPLGEPGLRHQVFVYRVR